MSNIGAANAVTMTVTDLAAYTADGVLRVDEINDLNIDTVAGIVGIKNAGIDEADDITSVAIIPLVAGANLGLI